MSQGTNGIQTPNDAVRYMLAAMGSAFRAAQKAAEQEAGQPTEFSNGMGAGAEALSAFQDGTQAGGTQCLWYPGPGNGRKIFNYDTGEWEEDC